MKRDLEARLIAWKKGGRMPLLLGGARQVGKTYLVESFGKHYFDACITINFEQSPHFKTAFQTLVPAAILAQLELLTGLKIVAGKTLLFLDEIQECPHAITALRYFKEQMPELHIIGAGSLLEFALSDKGLRMPVGRVQFLRLLPLSFAEFLDAMGEGQLRQHLQEVTLNAPPAEAVHQRLLELVRLYGATGGMPAALQAYRRSKSFLECQATQNDLLMTYYNDFGKYTRKSQHRILQILLERVPAFLGQWIKYVKLDPEIASRELREAIALLIQAGLFHQVAATAANGLPLAATASHRKFKLLFLDIGLAHRAAQLDPKELLKSDLILVNRGALAEQFVGQELLLHGEDVPFPSLFSWVRDQPGSTAEVDFLMAIDGRVVPIEVKAGATGRLKSLKIFTKERKLAVGVRISSLPLSKSERILTIPFYLIGQLPRLVK